jgi:hypothetical protein
VDSGQNSRVEGQLTTAIQFGSVARSYQRSRTNLGSGSLIAQGGHTSLVTGREEEPVPALFSPDSLLGAGTSPASLPVIVRLRSKKSIHEKTRRKL